MLVWAKVCELTYGFLWFVCGNSDVSPYKSFFYKFMPVCANNFNYKLTNFEGRIFITIISYYSQSEGYFKDIPLHFVKFVQVICFAQ